MAREWVAVEKYGSNNDGNPVRFTIADGVSVSKGQVLYLTDARQASGAALGSAAIAGVASEDKLAGDGITAIAVWTDGIFEAVASSGILVGDPVMMDSKTANCVTYMSQAQTATSWAAYVGRALETATADETINVRLNL